MDIFPLYRAASQVKGECIHTPRHAAEIFSRALKTVLSKVSLYNLRVNSGRLRIQPVSPWLVCWSALRFKRYLLADMPCFRLVMRVGANLGKIGK